MTKRRVNATKVIKTSSRPSSENASPDAKRADNALREQYKIIREDITKLREDLSKGYDLAKAWFDKKGLVRDLMRAK